MDEDDKWMRISPTGTCQLAPAPLSEGKQGPLSLTCLPI